MLTEVRKSIKLILYYFKFNLSAVMEYRTSFLIQTIGMIINNSAFIFFWWILFSNVKSIGGYGFRDEMLLWALMSTSFGLSFVIFGNSRQLTKMIIGGELDSYLIQPRDTLINILCSKTIVSAWGDTLYGIVMFFIVRGFDLRGFALFILFCLTGSMMFAALIVTVNSLSFYAGSVQGLSELIAQFLISFSIYPEGIFDNGIKIILYTVIPTGFIAYMPAKVIGQFSLYNALEISGVTIVWITIAYCMFYRGLKRYESGNLIVNKL